jgi:hypothetical protein
VLLGPGVAEIFRMRVPSMRVAAIPRRYLPPEGNSKNKMASLFKTSRSQIPSRDRAARGPYFVHFFLSYGKLFQLSLARPFRSQTTRPLRSVNSVTIR